MWWWWAPGSKVLRWCFSSFPCEKPGKAFAHKQLFQRSVTIKTRNSWHKWTWKLFTTSSSTHRKVLLTFFSNQNTECVVWEFMKEAKDFIDGTFWALSRKEKNLKTDGWHSFKRVKNAKKIWDVWLVNSCPCRLWKSSPCRPEAGCWRSPGVSQPNPFHHSPPSSVSC